MSIRPFKLINRSEGQLLTARLSEAVLRWSTLYVPADPSPQCMLISADEVSVEFEQPCEWLLGTRASGPALAIGLQGDWLRHLGGVLLTERHADALDPAGLALLRDVGSRMLEELGAGILDALSAKPPAEAAVAWTFAASPPMDAGAGNCFVFGQCQLGSLSLLVVLWPGTVLASLAPTAPRRSNSLPVEALSKALQAEAVVLEGIAGEAELAVEELSTLAVGDVLKLDRRISEPLQVRIHGGDVVCSARLGASRGHTALQLG